MVGSEENGEGYLPRVKIGSMQTHQVQQATELPWTIAPPTQPKQNPEKFLKAAEDALSTPLAPTKPSNWLGKLLGKR